MENVKKVLAATDWQLLALQKQALLARVTSADDPLNGLLHFLDAIQDAVLEDGLAPEHEVFPNPDWLELYKL